MQIDIPGIGVVEFPDSMGLDEIDAAARRLHQSTNTRTETAEAHTPAARTNRLEGDPSTLGFIKKLGQQAYDTVADLPKTIKGLTKIDPSELPGQIVRGVSQRVSNYANSPLETIYEDPLGFLGDVASVTGAGAAMAAPAKAGAREAVKQGTSAATKAAAVVPGVAKKAAPYVMDAAIDALPGSPWIRRGARMAKRAFERTSGAADEVAEAATVAPEAKLAEAMAEGYDRYMPNTSAPKPVEGVRLPPEFSVDLTSQLDELGTPALSPQEIARARTAERFGRAYRSEMAPVDPVSRYTRKLVTNPQEQELLRELTRARAQGF